MVRNAGHSASGRRRSRGSAAMHPGPGNFRESGSVGELYSLPPDRPQLNRKILIQLYKNVWHASC
jgi:hypothetical protein